MLCASAHGLEVPRGCFGVACFVHGLPELRLCASEARVLQRLVSHGKVHLGLTRCLSPRENVFYIVRR